MNIKFTSPLFVLVFFFVFLHHARSEVKAKELECFNCFHLEGDIDTIDYPCVKDEDGNVPLPPKEYLKVTVGLDVNTSIPVPQAITAMEARFAKRAKVSGKSKGIFGFHCTATVGRLEGQMFLIRYKSIGEISKPDQVECSTQWENPEPFGDTDLITEGVQCICGFEACNGFNLYQHQNHTSGRQKHKFNTASYSRSFPACSSMLIAVVVYQLIFSISDT